MRLDAAAQQALHVFPARGDAGANFSIYGLMNRARTPMGKRRLKVRCPLGCSSCADFDLTHPCSFPACILVLSAVPLLPRY